MFNFENLIISVISAIVFAMPAFSADCIVFSNNKQTKIKNAIIENGKAYLPASKIAKSLGGKFVSSKNGKLSFKTKTIESVFEEGSDIVLTNGKEDKFNKPIMKNGKTLYWSAGYFLSDAFSGVYNKAVTIACNGVVQSADNIKKAAAVPAQTAQNALASNNAAVAAAASIPVNAGKAEVTETKKTAAKKVEIKGMRYGSHEKEGYSRVVLDLSSPIDPENIEQIGYDGNYYILHINGGFSTVKEITGKLGKEAKEAVLSEITGIAELKIALSDKAGRVEWVQMSNPDRLKVDIFALKPGETREQIIDSETVEEEKTEEEAAEEKKEEEKIEQAAAEAAADADYSYVKTIKTEEQKKGKKVVVIDPGHGGSFKGIGGTSFTERKKTGTKTVYVSKKKQQYANAATCKKNNGKKACTKKTVPIYKTIKVLKEQDVNLWLSRSLKKVFEKDSRFEVIMTRNADVALGKDLGSDLRKRNEIAIENNADIFISMHIDAPPSNKYLTESCSDKYSGFFLLYRSARKDNPKGKTPQEILADIVDMEKAIAKGIALAESIDAQLEKAKAGTHLKRMYVPRPDTATGKTDMVLRTSRFPAVLIENGYLCNDKDRKWLQDEATRIKIGEAIHKGVVDYGRQQNWKGF